jgi:hypothetical protein
LPQDEGHHVWRAVKQRMDPSLLNIPLNMIPLQMTQPGKHTKNDGKSPISMAVFNSELLNYQMVDKDKLVETK